MNLNGDSNWQGLTDYGKMRIGLDRKDVVVFIGNLMVEVFGLLNVRVTLMGILQLMVVVEMVGMDMV